MKIDIDIVECIGCNMCGVVSNEVVRVDETGKAGLNPQVNLTDPAVIDAIKMAVQSCPVQAISISEPKDQ